MSSIDVMTETLAFQEMCRMGRQLMASPMDFTCPLAIFDLLKARCDQGNCLFTLSVIALTHRLTV